jgi:hypothetical protein
VILTRRSPGLACIVACLANVAAFAQIDPVKRDLIQIGYNVALKGHAPQSGYAFYYHNDPEFLRTNLAMRVAVAPTYMDSELGIKQALADDTDIGIGLAGGGFADNYVEVQKGTFLPKQSFNGFGGELSTSLYHLFNPGRQIPLNGILRGVAHYSTYEHDDKTDKSFQVPDPMGTFSVRTGLRWGGREPTLFPSLAMELSVWYQGDFRTQSETYGFNDRKLEPSSHLFWGQAYLAYVMPELKHSFSLSLTAGSSIDPDRFSAYRLGALLPLASEFPLSIPGYFYQEISAKDFLLFAGNYLMPLDKKERWSLDVSFATGVVTYLEGLEQPGNWHTGVGGGVLYKSDSYKVLVGYAYGVNAIRSDDRGAHSIGILMQLDLGQAKQAMFNPTQPSLWRGLQQVFGLFGS